MLLEEEFACGVQLVVTGLELLLATGEMSENTINAALRRLGYDRTVITFRLTLAANF